MPGPMVQMGASILCSHGGQGTPTAPNPRVLLSGAPAVVQTDATVIAGCPFATPGGPLPCVTVTWTVGATRVLVGGMPALLLQPAPGITVPNGVPANIVSSQVRVIAT